MSKLLEDIIEDTIRFSYIPNDLRTYYLLKYLKEKGIKTVLHVQDSDIMAIQLGDDKPREYKRVIILTAHYDTANPNFRYYYAKKNVRKIVGYLDNSVGVAILINLYQRYKNLEGVFFFLTNYEETGMMGAEYLSRTISNIDLAIVLDVGFRNKKPVIIEGIYPNSIYEKLKDLMSSRNLAEKVHIDISPAIDETSVFRSRNIPTFSVNPATSASNLEEMHTYIEIPLKNIKGTVKVLEILLPYFHKELLLKKGGAKKRGAAKSKIKRIKKGDVMWHLGSYYL